jgi:hypothetical protein
MSCVTRSGDAAENDEAKPAAGHLTKNRPIPPEETMKIRLAVALVYRLLNPLGFVAFKMGRLRGGQSRTDAKGAYLNRYVTDPAAAGKQSTHFQRNPTGRGQLAVFLSGGPPGSLDHYDPDSGASLAP